MGVRLGRLKLANPVLVASGTFGYIRELAAYVPLDRLGGLIPKTITPRPRAGNPTPRTVETPCGLLNAIGLDNDGIDHFIAHHLPYLRTIRTAVIANIAGEDEDQFVAMAERLSAEPGLAALELNISCPNVTHGLDLGVDPTIVRRLVGRVRRASDLPIIAKLTPNVTDVTVIAAAAAEGGADAVSLVNTFKGMAVDWRRRRPILANDIGGLSGPAIKPLALRMVWEVQRALPNLPIIGIGGIWTADDAMEFLVAGASAIQVGTATFADPGAAGRLLEQLPAKIAELHVSRVSDLVGTLRSNREPDPVPPSVEPSRRIS
ncbi:MAG: dihydroorotate dehydrogenase [Isosphaeraceae bacterium]|nr:MAG: dihydroorotate dehydrogenase [Isosphaeraceae bacterium]